MEFITCVDISNGHETSDVKVPSFSKKTEIIVPLATSMRSGRLFPSSLPSDGTDSSWTAVAKDITENMMTVFITPSPNCIIGEWNLRIETKEAGIPLTFHVESRIYILFNPWNKSEFTFKQEIYISHSFRVY